MEKIVDMRIEVDDRYWTLYVPIRTGHLGVRIERGMEPHLDQFLQTVLNTPSRRFGENPVSSKEG